jgi:cytochrome c oxidase subunit 4
MAQNQNNDHHEEHHIVPFAVLARVFVSLLVLTVLTVVTSRFHLGMFAAPVAFLIAGAKAFLVMAFFMGLKYDVKSNRAIFATAYVTLALLFLFCAIDIWTRVFQTSTL